MSVITSSFFNANRVTDRDVDTLQRNISNINSETYSARTVHKEVVVYNSGSFIIDKRELRKFDERMQEHFLSATNVFEELNAINMILSNAEEDLIGRDQSKDGIIGLFEEMQKAVMVFFEFPSDENARTVFFRNLDTFVDKLNNIGNFIDEGISTLDELINNTVKDFNIELSKVYENNINYVKDYYLRNGQANDYADLVDNALAKLSEITKLGLKPFRMEEGVKVDLLNIRILETTRRENLIYKDGELFIGSRSNTPVTEEMMNNQGKLAGYLKLKNQILPSFKANFEMFRETFVNEINAISNNSYYKRSEITHNVLFDSVDDSFGIESISGNTLRISVVDPDDVTKADIDVDLTDLFYDADGKVLPEDQLQKVTVKDLLLKIHKASIDALIPTVAEFSNNALRFKAPVLNGIRQNIVLSGDLVINGKKLNEFFNVNNLVVPNVNKNGYEVSLSAKESLSFQEMGEFRKDEPSNFREKNSKILLDLKNILTTNMVEFGEVETEVQGLSIGAHKTTFQMFINELVLAESEVISTYNGKAKSSEETFIIKKHSYLDSKQVEIATETMRYETVMRMKECLQKIYKMSNDVMKSLLEVM